VAVGTKLTVAIAYMHGECSLAAKISIHLGILEKVMDVMARSIPTLTNGSNSPIRRMMVSRASGLWSGPKSVAVVVGI